MSPNSPAGFAEKVWTNLQTPMFMSSPVLIGETIYGLTLRSKGQFVAIDAASGKTLWSTQGREVRMHR
jgi:outer membrane protein assembly factor BamB